MRGIQIRFGLPSCPACAGIALLLFINASYSSAQNSQPANQQQRPRKVGATATPSPGQTNSTGEEVGEGDVVRVETQLVTVPAVVTDRNGHPLVGMHADNFAVFEDGQPQRVTNFATAEAPFEIALLLDTSGSTREELGLIRDAANAFINALRGGDRVAIIAFRNAERNGST